MALALPLARLVPACQCQPWPHLRFRKRHVSFAAHASSRAAFAACAAAPALQVQAPEAEAEAETVEQVGPKTRLVAQNIPWDCTADEMRALFESHGSVVGVEVSVCFPSLSNGLTAILLDSGC
jgi:hypothetical protein